MKSKEKRKRRKWDNGRLDKIARKMNLKRIDNVVNGSVKVRMHCRICKHVYKVKPKEVGRGKGCPICNKINNVIKIKGITKWDYLMVKDMLESDDIELHERGFIDVNAKMHMKCKRCDNMMHRTLRSYLSSKYPCECRIDSDYISD